MSDGSGDGPNPVQFPMLRLRPPIDPAGDLHQTRTLTLCAPETESPETEPPHALTWPSLFGGRDRPEPPTGLTLPAINDTTLTTTASAGLPGGTDRPAHARSVAELSLLTLAAFSVAALRGTYHVVTWIKTRAEHRRGPKEAVTGGSTSTTSSTGGKGGHAGARAAGSKKIADTFRGGSDKTSVNPLVS